MDSIGGTIKHRVFPDVKSEKVSIKNAEHFASYADSILNGITSLYMPLEELLTEPKSVSKAPKILGTLEVHMIRRTFNSDGVCKLKFYHTATNQSHFHEWWYRKDGNPEVCGHPEHSVSFDPSMTYVKCWVQWLECTICDQWFHKRFFYVDTHLYFHVEMLLA